LDTFGSKDGGTSISEAGVLYPDGIVDTGEDVDASADEEYGHASK
jgi:hypothetical protein